MRRSAIIVLLGIMLLSSITGAAAETLLSGEDPLLATPQGRLAIGRAPDYVPSAMPESALSPLLRDSMEARREFGWSVVEQMLVPTIISSIDDDGRPTLIKVPRWQTFYEGSSSSSKNPGESDEITPLFVDLFTKMRDNPGANIDALIDDVLDEFSTKNLASGLTDANFLTVLDQHLGPDGVPEGAVVGGTGFTLFSPSFMAHMMREARMVLECNFNAVTATTPPASPENFTHCMSHEFPRSAVTVKTTWQPLDGPVAIHDTTASGIDAVIREGTWPSEDYFPDIVSPIGADKVPEKVTADSTQIYTNVSSSGRQYGLTGIHFVTKDVREWVWVSLWWDPDATTEDFGTDQPASIGDYNGGVWKNYKMCVNSAFVEGDPQPWSHYSGPQQPLADSLQAAFDAIQDQYLNGAMTTAAFAPKTPTPLHDALEPADPPANVATSWCSNPNVEFHRGNGRTSCIGCHQVAYTRNERRVGPAGFEHILVGDYPQFGRAQARVNFPAEFVWSFPFEFQRVIEDAAKSVPGFAWP